jgi:RNA polymerase sigma-54 factor
MALTAKLMLRQSQSLVMTPQLMQSIRLLQLSHLELERFIDAEIERNPLLERVEPREEPEPLETHKTAVGRDSGDMFDGEAGFSSEAIADRLDSSLENLFPDDPGRLQRPGPDLARGKSSGRGEAVADGFEMEDLASAPPTLADHIGNQIALAFGDPLRLGVARALADQLDEAGYLRIGLGEIAESLGVAEATVRDVLEVCRRFDPAGIFALDLADCLGLQLAERDRLDPAMQAMLCRLDLLARRDFAALKKVCGVDEEDLIDMLAEIRGLDPRPGLAFSAGASEAVVADVEVRAAGDGGWAVELNPETLPRVIVDNIYYTEVSRFTSSSAEKEFLADCLQSGNWLVRSLDQRARTILKVASEIVRQQEAFLEHGVRHLRPLNLRTVAEAIGMHESTVSRVTSNKYMLTPRGVFELRYFFTASIPAAGGGEAHSSEAVRDRIRELIDAEGHGEVLSDDAIVDILRKSGVDIARRTVAKYREGMNIASSVQRRREKRALALAGA